MTPQGDEYVESFFERPKEQEYNPTPIINEIRRCVEDRRKLSRLARQLGAKRSGTYTA
jgi:hypothetical protein